MNEHPNATLLRRGYAAFAEADLATLDSLFADDVSWRVAGTSPLAGLYAGKDELFGKFFAQLGQLTQGTFKAEIETVVADDEHAVAVVRHTGQREGRTLATHDILIFRLVQNRIAEVRHTSFDLYETDAFWA